MLVSETRPLWGWGRDTDVVYNAFLMEGIFSASLPPSNLAPSASLGVGFDLRVWWQK